MGTGDQIKREIRRPYNGQEVDEAHRLEMLCYPPETAGGREAFHDRYNRYPDYFRIARSSGQLVGIVNALRSQTPDLANDTLKEPALEQEAGPYLCILTVAVHPEWRRQGIGHALMRAVLQQARRDMLEAVVLMCESNYLSFYEQLGFTYLGLSDSRHGGRMWHEMRFNLMRS